MNDDLEGNGSGPTEVLSRQILLDGRRENREKLSDNN
jgi:hypothetical protein